MLSLLAVAPSSPMFIPQVSGEEITKVEHTVNGLLKLVIKIHALQPDYLVLLSPEAPRLHHRFSLAGGAFLGRVFAAHDDMGQVTEVTFPIPNEEFSSLCSYGFEHKIQVEAYEQKNGVTAIDNASLSFLYYLSQVKCFPKTLLLGMSDLGEDKYKILGKSVRAWIESKEQKKVVVVCMGDFDEMDGVYAHEMKQQLCTARTWEHAAYPELPQSSLWQGMAFIEGVLGGKHPLFHLLGDDLYDGKLFSVGYFEEKID